MASRPARGGNFALRSASLRNAVDLLDPAQQEGLKSLMSRLYKKPVELNITKLSKPHLNADILGEVVAQQLRDRARGPRSVIRNAAWKAQLPNDRTVTAMQQAKLKPAATVSSAVVQQASAFARQRTSTSRILQGLTLSQVSSVYVQAGGRLSKRLTANRAASKSARRGANAKGPNFMVRGFVKSHVSTANRAGKRRIGSYGVKVRLGHS